MGRGLLGHHIPLRGWNQEAPYCPSRSLPASGQSWQQGQTDLQEETRLPCTSQYNVSNHATLGIFIFTLHIQKTLTLLFYFAWSMSVHGLHVYKKYVKT